MATENCVWSNLIALFPELTDADFAPQSGTILLQNDSDGFGTYIAKWEHPTLEQPSDSDLKITRAPVVIDVIPEVIEEIAVEFGEMPEIPEDAMVTFVAATE